MTLGFLAPGICRGPRAGKGNTFFQPLAADLPAIGQSILSTFFHFFKSQKSIKSDVWYTNPYATQTLSLCLIPQHSNIDLVALSM